MTLGKFPPELGEWGLQGALYHGGLDFIEMELSDSIYDEPNDWSLCRRHVRAGVRIGMIEEVVFDKHEARRASAEDWKHGGTPIIESDLHRPQLRDRARQLDLAGAPEIGTEPLSASYLRTIRQFCPPGARVADLGCLEGGYSVLLARAGYEVVGIEGQPDNFDICRQVAEQVGLDESRLRPGRRPQPRVPTEIRRGPLRRACSTTSTNRWPSSTSWAGSPGRLLILPTNFATVEGRELATFGDLLDAELSEHEGRRGRWFGEIPGPWSSLGNARSFWLERDDLLRTMIDAGFPSVFEQFDWIDDAPTWEHVEDRKVAVFVGVKPPG